MKIFVGRIALPVRSIVLGALRETARLPVLLLATVVVCSGFVDAGSEARSALEASTRRPIGAVPTQVRAEQPDPEAADDRGRILQLNICGAAKQCESAGSDGSDSVVPKVISQIDRLKPDVVSLNEACVRQYRKILEGLEWEMNGEFGVAQVKAKRCEDGGGGGYGNAVLTRGQIRSSEEFLLPRHPKDDNELWEPRVLVCAETSVRSAPVQACSTHLGVDRRERTEQAAAVAEYAEHYWRSGYPVILGGDFNAEPTEPELDSFYSHHGGTGVFNEVDQTDFQWFRGECPQGSTTCRSGEPTFQCCAGWGVKKLDYIFVSPEFVNLEAEARYVSLTDHRALFGQVDLAVGGPGPTRIAYEGPTTAAYHDEFIASARLWVGPSPGAPPSEPLPGAPVSFTLGSGGGGPQTCTATTDQAGRARCALMPTQRPGRATLTVRYAGNGHAPASVTVPFTITRQRTAVDYRSPARVANGRAARLTGVLTEDNKEGPPIGDRTLQLALGSGQNRQSCTGRTDASGTAHCTIASVDQPLNQDATVPVGVGFAGDAYYLPSRTSETVLLEHYTGRAYGLAGSVDLPVVPVKVSPQPDTGAIRTARASSTTTPCTAELTTTLVTAKTLCPKVRTRLAPGGSTATSTVADTTIDIAGLPTIEVQGVTARSTSTCASGGSASGSSDLTLSIAGRPVHVPTAPNSEISLPGGLAQLVVNEQRPVPGADHGLTVNAVHLRAGGGLTDIVIASATSDVHNCAY